MKVLEPSDTRMKSGIDPNLPIALKHLGEAMQKFGITPKTRYGKYDATDMWYPDKLVAGKMTSSQFDNFGAAARPGNQVQLGLIRRVAGGKVAGSVYTKTMSPAAAGAAFCDSLAKGKIQGAHVDGIAKAINYAWLKTNRGAFVRKTKTGSKVYKKKGEK